MYLLPIAPVWPMPPLSKILKERAEERLQQAGSCLVERQRGTTQGILLVLTKLLTRRDPLVMNCRYNVSINIEC